MSCGSSSCYSCKILTCCGPVTLQDAKLLPKDEIVFGRVWLRNAIFLYCIKRKSGEMASLTREVSGKTIM